MMKNIAFIDGQNLHLGTAEDNWKVDHKRLRIYLHEKYSVEEAYYFLGYVSDGQHDLYNNLQKAGFIVTFKEHHELFEGNKKGNVDTDIVFEIMKKLIEEKFDKIILISGDGDYKKVVDYLIKKDKFEKLLFSNQKFASSLYKEMTAKYYSHLGEPNLRKKIKHIKKREP